MTADPSIFDSNLAAWKLDEGTPWGRLRRSIITGYIVDDEIKSGPGFFAKLERLEAAMSARHPYNLMAKFCHLIAAPIDGERVGGVAASAQGTAASHR